MQLKKITIKGFKSFPEKTTLEFNEGVTAIVGPNGSGKSNIIEAIRWVMGEQSAKTLRGDRMNDVIFSGTHERKPLNIAEVEIILDNSDNYLDIDFEEVSVLRRISRSGESTYMINKQECRLKDIISLFMDSGLGKESFSIISQGQVEAVFNSKPEDRRGIFEEAAGVFKYKVRKQDAEKKLGQTQENLDRVQDIIYELESQLDPLRKQADIAQSYLDQKSKLSNLDIGVTVWQIKDMIKRIDKDKTSKKSIIKEMESNKIKLSDLEGQQEVHQLQLNELENARERLNIELIEVVREKERTEAALNLFDEKARHREVFIHEKEMSIQQISQRVDSLKQELNRVVKEYREKDAHLKSVMAELKDLEQKRHYLDGDKDSQLEELRSQYIETLQKQTSLRNQKNYLEEESKRNNRNKDKSTEALSILENNIEHLEKELDEKKEKHHQVSQELLALLNDYKEIDSLIGKSKENLQTKNSRLIQMTNELERAKAKHASLTEMQENYAGYYAGVRTVMQNKDRFKGIVGTVAELIKVPKDYIQAIDTVLSSSGQFIVVENEASGREAINYLKKSRGGRATFLPLTTIKSRFIPEPTKQKIQNIPGYIGIASDLVSNQANIDVVIENLLGQTIIAESLESANEIARAIQFRNRVISLEGDVINAGGSMTGGGSRQNNTSPIFTQKAELETLTKFISENEKVIEHLNKNLKDVENEQAVLEEKVEKVREAGEHKRLEEQRLKNELENTESSLERLNRELKVSAFEADESQKLIKEQKERLLKIEADLQEADSEVIACNKQMDLLASEQENIDEEKEKLDRKINKVNETRHEAREILASLKTNQESLESRLNESVSQIEELEKDIQSFNEEVEQLSKNDLLKKMAHFKQKQKDIEQSQLVNKEKYTEESDVHSKFKTQINQVLGRNQYLIDEKSKLDIQISRNDVKMDHRLNYLVEEYKIGFEEAKRLEEPEIGIEEAQKQVRLLKKGIEELGSVNLNAIEEYGNVRSRFDFLSEQQNDLIEAKANLYNTMDEMDAIVEKQFKETFERIQKEFALVFPKMFGGGYAELVLNNPDNLLETGIEIIAQPPGKRLTRLSLLSGGERALTAISLLFAIIQVNPIPFCILDEAEAALDDANVDRFGKYLEEFEYDTQFIVITHRKGTMEHSDQLYGITMQEKGISKIVSVSLSEAQEYEGVT